MIGGAHDPHFVAPDSIELFGKYRVVKQDGTPINVAADRDGLVSGCNLFPHAIWENVNVFLNGIQIRYGSVLSYIIHRLTILFR